MATQRQARRAAELNSDALSRFPNVVGLGTEQVQADQRASGTKVQHAVAVFVERKVPVAELADDEVLPTYLEIQGRKQMVKVPVTVVESGAFSFENQSLPMEQPMPSEPEEVVVPQAEVARRDQRVSNRTTVENVGESPAPEKGPGRAANTRDDMETVAGYSLPSAGFAPQSVTDDLSLEMTFPDIAAASFGAFVPESVLGVDDRRQIATTKTYPWRAHASLLITAADGSRWIGTGWFISPRVLVTAGHVVCIKGSGVPGRDGWVSSMRVVPGRNGTEKPFGEVESTLFHSVRGWVDDGDQEYDYGAIVLDEPKGQETGWFGFGTYPDDELKTVVGNISGYPGDKPPGTQWYAARRIHSVSARKVHYEIDTAGGQSGSAVYRIRNGQRHAIAVHAYGGGSTNSGTRVNQAVFDNLTAWRDEFV